MTTKEEMSLSRKAVSVFSSVGLALFVSAAVSAASFTSENMRIQFDTPSSWTAEEDLDFGEIFILPNDEQAKTNEGTGMSIYRSTSFEEYAPVDLSGAMAYLRAKKDKAGRPYTVLSEEDITVGGYPAKQITYTSQFEGSLKGLARNREIYTFGAAATLLYEISFSSLDSTFDEHWPDAKSVLDSIKFTA